MEKNKNLLTLILALSLPILLILVLGCYLYLPRLFVKPTEKFLYYKNGYSTSIEVRYGVQNNHVVIQASSYNSDYTGDMTIKSQPDIYLYDTATDQSQKLSFDQASVYLVSSELKSSGGFEIINGSSGGDFLFGYSSNNYYDRYLKRDSYSKKLNINLDNNNNFNFLGWLEE